MRIDQSLRKTCSARQGTIGGGCCVVPRRDSGSSTKSSRRVACGSHGGTQEPAWRVAARLEAPRLVSEMALPPHQTSAAPSELLPTEFQASAEQLRATRQPLTVYSLRLQTGSHAGAALSDPTSAVNVLLVGQDGRAILHRISALNDPAESREHVHSICQVVDASVGANCPVVAPTSPGTSDPSTGDAPATPSSAAATSDTSMPSPSSAVAIPKLRFRQGHVDEVSFLAPELGPLVGLLVGTESGTWELEEVDVSSSRTRHSDRFVCRTKLGGKLGQGARWLLPVPPGAFVYGAGDSTVVLTKEDANATHRAMVLSLPDAQSRLLSITILLAVCGASIAGMVAGTKAALPFAIGAFSGIAMDRLDTEALGKALEELWIGDSDQSKGLPPTGKGPGKGVHAMRTGPQVQSNPAMRTLQQQQPQQQRDARGPAAGSNSGSGGSSSDYMPRRSRQQLWQQGMREIPPPMPLLPCKPLAAAARSTPRDVRPTVTTGTHGRQQAAAGQRGGFPTPSSPSTWAGNNGFALPAALAACAVLATAAMQGDASGVGGGMANADSGTAVVAAAAAAGVAPMAALLQGPLVSPEAVVSELEAAMQQSVLPGWQALQASLMGQAGEEGALQLLLAALGFAANKVAKVEQLLADDEELEIEQASVLSGPLDGAQHGKH